MEIVRLRKIGLDWEFESESALEDFVWMNLQQLLSLTPLKRQYRVKDQICDIIAVDKNKRLVVLELKNTEDRYIVQQLTRYYDVLLEEKPFQEQIDYEQPVQLIAIAPSFHKDSLTDRKYHNLQFNFVDFEVIKLENSFYLSLNDLETGKISKLSFFYQEKNFLKNVALPPKKLLNFLDNCNNCSSLGKDKVLSIRHKLLSFDARMQEIVKTNKIEFGKQSNHPCAELYFRSSLGLRGELCLFLRLPEPSPYYRQTVIRLNILTDKDCDKFSEMQFFHKAFIYNKSRSGDRFHFPHFADMIKSYAEDEEVSKKAQICYQNYKKLIENRSNSVDCLIDIALETWLKRL